MPESVPLVRVTRGGIEESVHRGALAVVSDGCLVRALGDAARAVFYRSANKALQALEVVRSGAADAFGLTPPMLAVAAGSHVAEPAHLAVVRDLLARAGVPESALRCGGHRSPSADVAFAQRRDGVATTSILSNCSGKHAAMLACARHGRHALDDYLEPSHPVQERMRATVATFAGLEPSALVVGRDGCGAPAFALPLAAMALSIARLVDPDDALPPDLAAAARRVVAATLAHPEMIAGTERFDTDLVRAGEGRVFAKAGAEGVHVAAIVGRRTALAVKADDGSDRGYRAVVVEWLRREGALTPSAADDLRRRHAPEEVRTIAGAPAGRLEVLI